MQDPRSTCWTLIRSAAAGAASDREIFARQYEPVVRAYLTHRWKRSPLLAELDDVAQEVFIECFRQGGVLDRVQQGELDSFRGFLHGVTRNVAMRCERRIGKLRERQNGAALESDVAVADEATLSQVFDRAWALSLVQEAARLQSERAEGAGEKAQRRVELLRLRAHEGLPIREIARVLEEDVARVHKEYARARNEFRAALEDVITFHYPTQSQKQVAERCTDLLGLLGGA